MCPISPVGCVDGVQFSLSLCAELCYDSPQMSVAADLDVWLTSIPHFKIFIDLGLLEGSSCSCAAWAGHADCNENASPFQISGEGGATMKS